MKMKSHWFIATVITGALLSGCGKSGVETGDVFVIKESIICADTIETYEDMHKESVIENDGETKTVIFEEEEVTVVEISEEDHMVRFAVTDGYDEGTVWWVNEKVLTKSADKVEDED